MNSPRNGIPPYGVRRSAQDVRSAARAKRARKNKIENVVVGVFGTLGAGLFLLYVLACMLLPIVAIWAVIELVQRYA